jgi:hypothetical protein
MNVREASKLAGFVIGLDRLAHCASPIPLSVKDGVYAVDLHLVHCFRHVYITQYSQRAALDAVNTVWADYCETLMGATS